MAELKELLRWIFDLNSLIFSVLLLPQIFRLVKHKDAKDTALLTFVGFLLLNLAIAAHGVAVKSALVIFGALLAAVLSLFIVTLIVAYRIKQRLLLRSGRLKTH
jgi:uncharacterized protein with PQ loop repeat